MFARRLSYLLIILVWLFLMSLPFFAFRLAARKQLLVGGDEGSRVRIFLVQERTAEGIGVEWTRPFRTGCTKTSVRYFMWAGEPGDVTYCRCLDPQTGAALPVTEDSCAVPID